MSESVQAWRLVKRARAESAFAGEGAFRYGGRWNSRGLRAVYSSSSLALALLEILVHLDPAARLPELVAIPVHIPKDLIDELTCPIPARLGAGFTASIEATRRIGDGWLRAGSCAALCIPSAIVPIERNFLLNPEHPDFHRLSFGQAEHFPLDVRLMAD